MSTTTDSNVPQLQGTSTDPAVPVAPQPTAAVSRETPLFSQHAAIVLMMAVIAGCLAGALTFWKSHSLAEAALAGLATAGAGTPILHKLIG
ncbi:hypothetical protein [Streptomyces sp. NPDC101150]|uniref:hypothetical protein n=1 Tax=Streptomyces sp. NPDC101150 TaxID=3366114 RepID=UPI003817FB0A